MNAWDEVLAENEADAREQATAEEARKHPDLADLEVMDDEGDWLPADDIIEAVSAVILPNGRLRVERATGLPLTFTRDGWRRASPF